MKSAASQSAASAMTAVAPHQARVYLEPRPGWNPFRPYIPGANRLPGTGQRPRSEVAARPAVVSGLRYLPAVQSPVPTLPSDTLFDV